MFYYVISDLQKFFWLCTFDCLNHSGLLYLNGPHNNSRDEKNMTSKRFLQRNICTSFLYNIS